MGLVQRGQFSRNAAEHGRRIPSSIGFLLGLDCLPVVYNVTGRGRFLVAKYVRVPSDEFFRDAIDHIVDPEFAQLFPEAGMEDNMQEEISKFFGQSAVILRVDGFEDFVDLLDEHRLQRSEVLFLVPGASIGSPQPGHDPDKPFKLAARHRSSPQKLDIIQVLLFLAETTVVIVGLTVRSPSGHHKNAILNVAARVTTASRRVDCMAG